ncbi:DUF4360 domain-containing protein [Actinomadura litoris]|uniref:DUF4360 domain-containing protein n=1 Tax=Actinomadura litoris TaxID=2678616 RepID=A0A7K1L9K2_9ACTN|nr:DUF4360 domain-containing protein [Actinomadura litoris]MUN41099.1 DUF4360 domain-containing protein [Actinomadura litoris]
MMNSKRTATALAGTLGLTAPTAAPTSAAPAPAMPEGASIEVVSVNGSGCAKGSGTVVMSEDRTGFTVNHSRDLAYAGNGAPVTASRKNCQISLLVKAPHDYTYAIGGADYRGFAGLERGASVRLRTRYYFQGLRDDSKVDHALQGPYFDGWQFTDVISTPHLAYKACGEDRALNINTELRVDPGTSGSDKMSFVSMESTSSSARYDFAWKRCP